MPLAASSISVAARALRSLLADAIEGLDEANVFIAHPKQAVDSADGVAGHHCLNLFFYRVARDGYPADGVSANPFYVRLHCLVTALATDEGTIKAGENDLRLLSEVLRVLHESPQLSIESGGVIVASLQIVLLELSLDDVNKVWSTQGDAAYRPSVAYELALAPVPLAQPRPSMSPRVVSIGVEARHGIAVPALPEAGFDVVTQKPVVGHVEIDATNAGWVPHVVLVVDGSELEYSIVTDSVAAAADIAVLPAGAVGESLAVRWELWTAQGGWHELGSSPDDLLVVGTQSIDPSSFDSAHVRTVPSPFATSPETVPAQGLLQLVRNPGAPDEIRSNSLLVTVTHVASP